MQMPTQPLIFLLLLSAIFAEELEQLPSPPQIEPEQGTIALIRTIYPNNTKDSVKFSPQFVEFLGQDLPGLIQELKGSSCGFKCAANIGYIQKIQTEYGYINLFELYYHLSLTQGCFCYDSGFFESGGILGTTSFELDIGIGSTSGLGLPTGSGWSGGIGGSSGGLGLGLPTGSGSGWSGGSSGLGGWKRITKYGNYNNCRWENLLYWLIKLIRSRIYDLRRVNVENVCYEYICNRF